MNMDSEILNKILENRAMLILNLKFSNVSKYIGTVWHLFKKCYIYQSKNISFQQVQEEKPYDLIER